MVCLYKQIGEAPDSLVYGVKIQERLIVPEGSDVVQILKRHYDRHADVEIEYRRRPNNHRHVTEDITETSYENTSEDIEQIRKSIRKKVEDEFARRSKRASSTGITYEITNNDTYRPSYRRNYETNHEKVALVDEPVTRRRYNDVDIDEQITSRRSRKKKTTTTEIMSDDEYDVRRAYGLAGRKKLAMTAPTFASRLKSKWIFEGETALFTCSVNGLPTPEVFWFKDGRPLNDGDGGHIRITVSNENPEIIVSNVC